MINNIVGDNIRRLRERLSITQEELALRCNLTQGHINYIENGKRGYTQRSLTRIAKGLGVEVSKLFESEETDRFKVAEGMSLYGKRKSLYEEIIALLEKLPNTAVEHYKLIIAAEVSIRGTQRK